MATKIIRNFSRRSEIISLSAPKKAIEYMEADCVMGKNPVAVFLTDLHMPEMDGFAFCMA